MWAIAWQIFGYNVTASSDRRLAEETAPAWTVAAGPRRRCTASALRPGPARRRTNPAGQLQVNQQVVRSWCARPCLGAACSWLMPSTTYVRQAFASAEKGFALLSQERCACLPVGDPASGSSCRAAISEDIVTMASNDGHRIIAHNDRGQAVIVTRVTCTPAQRR